MPIRVKCESCKKTLSVKDHHAGKKIKCPVCQSIVPVPANGQPPWASSPPGSKPAAPKKPGPAAKDAPIAAKSKTNGTPPPESAKANGAVPKKSEPENVERPPENVEEEALSALADEPPPPEEDTAPKTIDFKCQWCDEEVKLPIEQAGKQSQCPNPECRRIIKVPLPKMQGKKDWRKMDRRGPAAALINQPEALDDAWGTEEATRARQSSLAEAGALEQPEKPPIGAFGWLRRAFIFFFVVGLAAGAVYGVIRLRSSNEQMRAIHDVEDLVKPPANADQKPKIQHPLLRAEGHRTLGLLFLREAKTVRDPATEATKHLRDGALGLASLKFVKLKSSERDLAVNEQLFLIDLALAQIELGGEGDDLLEKKRIPWTNVFNVLQPTFSKIQSPEVQAIALREVGARLIEKKQPQIAVQLAGLKNDAAATDFSAQHIALVVAIGDTEKIADFPKEPDPKKEPLKLNERVGFAEGYARKGKFEEALALAKAEPGLPNERFEALLGIACVAAADPEQKAKAVQLYNEALTVAKGPGIVLSPWHRLQLVKLAARLEVLDPGVFNNDGLIGSLPNKELKAAYTLRAKYEIFLAKCEKSPASITASDLEEIETLDTEGATLGLAWATLARVNGATRAQNRKAFDQRASNLKLQNGEMNAESLRNMVDVGSYLSGKK